jgi:hypothetical protein
MASWPSKWPSSSGYWTKSTIAGSRAQGRRGRAVVLFLWLAERNRLTEEPGKAIVFSNNPNIVDQEIPGGG